MVSIREADATSIIHIYVVQTQCSVIIIIAGEWRQHLTGKHRHAPMEGSDISIGTIIVLRLWEIAEVSILCAIIWEVKVKSRLNIWKVSS